MTTNFYYVLVYEYKTGHIECTLYPDSHSLPGRISSTNVREAQENAGMMIELRTTERPARELLGYIPMRAK